MTTKIELYNGATLVATKTSAPFTSIDWTPVTTGAATLTAKRYEDGVLVATSSVKNYTVAAPAGYDADYQAVLDFATANSIALPDSTQQAIDNQLLIDYKATGAWVKDDVFFKFKGTASSAFKLIDWKRKAQAVAVGGLTWDATGVKSDGTTGYIKTGYNLLNNKVNYSLNDAGLTYVGVEGLDSLGAVIGGSSGSVPNWTTWCPAKYTGNNLPLYGLNGYKSEATRINKIGLNGLYRNSSAELKAVGSSERTITVTSGGVDNAEMFILAFKQSDGTPSNIWNEKISFATIGASKYSIHASVATVLE